MDERRRKIQAVMFIGLSLVLKKKRKKRSVWVKEYRQRYGHLNMIHEIQENYPDDYRNYLRMDNETFNLLLNKIRDRISKQNTVMRESISAELRLVATLRYLATGRSFEDLKFTTGISAPSLSKIIPETCKAIYDCLKLEYLKMPSTKEEWKKVAYEFQEKWHFINCGGAMDGKHIRIVPLPHSGATYYNYKHFYSIVLLALVGPNYEFLYVNVGKNGRLSDGGILEYTDFYHRLQSGALNLPNNNETVKNLNFVFLGDEAFGLEPNFLKPYSQRELDYEKRIYNYRLSRARNVVENAFGIITSRFRILHTAINITNHDKICHIVLAICVLHNFLCKKGTYSSLTDNSVHQREVIDNEVPLLNLERRATTRMTSEAKQNRENYKIYFNADGRVEWQDSMVSSGRA